MTCMPGAFLFSSQQELLFPTSPDGILAKFDSVPVRETNEWRDILAVLNFTNGDKDGIVAKFNSVTVRETNECFERFIFNNRN